MMRVLIVEDEKPIARSIAILVGDHPDCTVAGTAANGQAALDLLAQEPVDLLLTDIRMPVMDGIQLMEEAHKRYPDLQTVVLSGYSDFSYAQSAIKNGAFDYLLKPVDPDQLYHMLDRAYSAHIKTYSERMHARIQDALDDRPVTKTQSVWPVLAIIPEASMAAWHRVIKQAHGADLTFHRYSNDSWILVWQQKPEHARVSELIKKAGSPYHMAGSTNSIPLQKLRNAVDRLHSVLLQNCHLFVSDDLWIQPEGSAQTQRHPVLEQWHPETAADAIMANRVDEVKKQLSKILTRDVLQTDLEHFLEAVLMNPHFSRHLTALRRDAFHAVFAKTLQKTDDPSACAVELAEELMHLNSLQGSHLETKNLLDEIIWYMDANYHLPLSIETIARHYAISPRHLNRSFQERMGLSPKDYLQKIRIQQATKMLKDNPDIMVKDVAASVGYVDPLYFSKMFKKHTGTWPTDIQGKKHD